MTATNHTPEEHPLEPFLPTGAKMLMLGSFPPPRERWSMEFFYPNLQNDMWRIFGLVFFGDREHFLTKSVDTGKPVFSAEGIKEFLTVKGIALSDTARAAVRAKGNASDKFLEITETVDLAALLTRIPECRAIVTTGDKASKTLSAITGSPEVAVGSYVDLTYHGSSLRHYRMPSSSRAYPLPIGSKAEAYAAMFRREGML